MITVAFTVSCKRPRYLERAVESWARCAYRGEARFLFSLEPPPRSFGVAGFGQYVKNLLGDATVIVRPEHLGCNRNTYQALRDGFAVSDFTVLAEEDIEVSDDALGYLIWSAEKYRRVPEAMAVCAHVKAAGDGGQADVFRAPWFSPLVWGTWRDRWQHLIEPGWDAYQHGWDGHVREVGASNPERFSVFPALSRSRHFGESSTLTPRQAGGAPNYFHRTALTSCFSTDYGRQEYREARVAGATLY